MMKEQLEQFDLANQIDKITFVTDHRSNFKKAFSSHKVLYCVAHQLNNILKRCFYHMDKKQRKDNKSPIKAVLWSRMVVETKMTPTKKKAVAARTGCASPELDKEPNSDLDDVSRAES
jgi:ribosomal protein S15P/S13E